ncbi:MAG: DUF2071 domain-containing protein [Acidobacteriia bacterium]|nr:DUF2071 domain-containing protein [Terriglobia bacterium]
MNKTHRVFLTAEWRDLVMLNYEVDPALLREYVPPGTQLDSFGGKTYLSLVGFRFLNTRMFGKIPIPFHRDFEEVNLRFYVRRKEEGEERRGVVFIAEIVPKQAVARIARLAYGENYICLPMKHCTEAVGPGREVQYQWQAEKQWCKLWAQAEGPAVQPGEGSREQFIAEHYWGYSARPGRDCLEYRVEHTPWNVWTCTEAGFEGDASAIYGAELGRVLQRRPDCAFIADGSPVSVFTGRRIA